MEVSQFTYFQQVGGIECDPVSTELTYGLERLAMYVAGGREHLRPRLNGASGDRKITYAQVFKRAEREFSDFNFRPPTPAGCSSISATPRRNASADRARHRPAGL